MRKYHYHVSYYRSGSKSDGIGDCIIDTTEPIKTAEALNAARELIESSEGGRVVILYFTLLRIENGVIAHGEA